MWTGLRRDGDRGVPNHVHADVHRGDTAAPFPAGSHPRLPGSGAGPAVPGRHGVVRGRAGNRVYPPSQFGRFSPLVYAVLILAGILASGIFPPLLLDRLRKAGEKATRERAASPV